MKKTITTISAIILIFTSCGPSKEQVEARQKFVTDSITQSAQQELLNQQAAAQAEADESINQEILRQQLIDLKAQLAAEETKMIDIQNFKLLRTPDEKAQQVADQTRVIEEIKFQIKETEKQIKN